MFDLRIDQRTDGRYSIILSQRTGSNVQIVERYLAPNWENAKLIGEHVQKRYDLDAIEIH